MSFPGMPIRPKSKEPKPHWMRRCMQNDAVKSLGKKYNNHRPPLHTCEDLCETLWNNHCERFLQDKEAERFIDELESDEG